MDEDIRWKQRFSNYKKALNQLKKFIDKGDLSLFKHISNKALIDHIERVKKRIYLKRELSICKMANCLGRSMT